MCSGESDSSFALPIWRLAGFSCVRYLKSRKPKCKHLHFLLHSCEARMWSWSSLNSVIYLISALNPIPLNPDWAQISASQIKECERWKGPKRSSFLNSYVTCKEAKVQRGLGSQWLIKSWFWYSTLLYIANGRWCLVNIPWKHASRIFALTSNSRRKFLQILLLYFESCYCIDIGTVNVTII